MAVEWGEIREIEERTERERIGANGSRLGFISLDGEEEYEKRGGINWNRIGIRSNYRERERDALSQLCYKKTEMHSISSAFVIRNAFPIQIDEKRMKIGKKRLMVRREKREEK